jgi:hypothetical protein
MRSMSTTSALGRTSPSGGGGGIVGGGGMALNGMTNAAALAEQVAFQDPTEAGGASAPSGNSGDGGLILYWFEQFGNDLADLFGGGGGSDLPPNYYVFQHRLNRPHGGRHPLYTDIIGVSNTLIVDQRDSAPDTKARPGTPGSRFSFVLPPLSKEPNPQRVLCQTIAWNDFWHEIRIISAGSAAIFGAGTALCAGGDLLTGGRAPFGQCVEMVAGATLRVFAATTEVAAYGLLLDLERCNKRYPLTS